MKKSLGLIETEGLAAGIEAADAAVKSANVKLIGYELTRGGGWTTIKVEGDVGAVKAAVDAARIAAAKVNRVVSTRVIPRPAEGLDALVHSPDTVGDAQASTEPDMPKPPTPSKHSVKVKEEEPSTEPKEQMKEVQQSREPKQEDKTVKLKEESVPDEASKLKEESVPDEASKLEEEPVPDETAKPEEEPVPDVPAENAKEAEPDSVETPSKETVNEEADLEQKSQKPANSKSTKRTTASKGYKGGKRGNNKQETTE